MLKKEKRDVRLLIVHGRRYSSSRLSDELERGGFARQGMCVLCGSRTDFVCAFIRPAMEPYDAIIIDQEDVSIAKAITRAIWEQIPQQEIIIITLEKPDEGMKNARYVGSVEQVPSVVVGVL